MKNQVASVKIKSKIHNFQTKLEDLRQKEKDFHELKIEADLKIIQNELLFETMAETNELDPFEWKIMDLKQSVEDLQDKMKNVAELLRNNGAVADYLSKI